MIHLKIAETAVLLHFFELLVLFSSEGVEINNTTPFSKCSIGPFTRSVKIEQDKGQK